jgi:Holliday junction resolvase RusA-like endonuclease
MSFTLIVPGKPMGKQRARARTHGAGVYTPKETVEAEGNVRAAWHAAGEPRIVGRVPVKVLVIAALRRPQGHWKANGHLSKAGLAAPLPLKKPDVDNLLKLQMDGLNGCAYDDDVVVVDSRAVKRWAAPQEVEHVRVEVQEVERG